VRSLMVAAVSCVIVVGSLVGDAVVSLSCFVWFVNDNSLDLYLVSCGYLIIFVPPPHPIPPPPLPPPLPVGDCAVAVDVPERSLHILTRIAVAACALSRAMSISS
jgi:hypothetical protein